MGYYAYGSGTATLKNGIDKDTLRGKLDELTDQECSIDYDFVNGDITFSDNGDYSYDEDNIMDFLNTLIPYITDGEISYSGDDDCYWKFQYNPKTKEWDELEGDYYYSMDDFSDEVLIEELQKRGYTITKQDHSESKNDTNFSVKFQIEVDKGCGGYGCTDTLKELLADIEEECDEEEIEVISAWAKSSKDGDEYISENKRIHIWNVGN